MPQLYECACQKLGGKPVSMVAAQRIIEEVKAGDRVLLVSDFASYPNMPFGEDDGPLGVASLARAVRFGLGAVPVLIAISVKSTLSQPGQDAPDFFRSITQNGLFVALAALTIELGLFLPLAVSVVAGDSVAGEANIGTLRYLLTVPVTRLRLLLVKYAAIVVEEVKHTREGKEWWPFFFKLAVLVFIVESLFGNLISRAKRPEGAKVPLFEVLRQRNPGIVQ